jgi:hypothetical protein
VLKRAPAERSELNLPVFLKDRHANRLQTRYYWREKFGPSSVQNHSFLTPETSTQRRNGNRIIKVFGRGGGDRTHDLRLKRPLLYH